MIKFIFAVGLLLSAYGTAPAMAQGESHNGDTKLSPSQNGLSTKPAPLKPSDESDPAKKADEDRMIDQVNRASQKQSHVPVIAPSTAPVSR